MLIFKINSLKLSVDMPPQALRKNNYIYKASEQSKLGKLQVLKF